MFYLGDFQPTVRVSIQYLTLSYILINRMCLFEKGRMEGGISKKDMISLAFLSKVALDVSECSDLVAFEAQEILAVIQDFVK